MKAKIKFTEINETILELDVPDDIKDEHPEVIEAWAATYILENPDAGEKDTELKFDITTED